MAANEVVIDGNKCKGTVKEDRVLFWPSECKTGEAKKSDGDSTALAFDDIISLKYEGPPGSVEMVTVIHFIERLKDCHEWVNKTLKLAPCSGKEEEYKLLVKELQLKFDQVVETRPKKVLVLINPIGGKRLGMKMYDTIVLPLFKLAGMSVELIVSERRKHLMEVMSSYDYKAVDGIVMVGGDGTLHEVINVLIKRTQEEAGIDFNDSSAVLQPVPIPLSIIPTGTENVTAVQCTGCKDVTTATLHIIRGKQQDFDILSTHCDGRLVGYSRELMGFGLVSEFLSLSDRKLRWLKAFRYRALNYLYVFRRAHYLETVITLYKRTNAIPVEDRDVTKADNTEEEIINQRTTIFFAWTFNRWLQSPESKGKISVIMYKEMGHFDTYRTCKSMGTDPHNRETREAHSVKIKFKRRPNIPSVYNEVVCLDGELVTCSKPEYFVRVWHGVINMFSSV